MAKKTNPATQPFVYLPESTFIQHNMIRQNCMHNGTLDVCWSDLLEICANMKEMTIRIKEI